jgi:hypothetical protein
VGPRAGPDVCEKSLPTGIRSPDRPARSQSRYFICTSNKLKHDLPKTQRKLHSVLSTELHNLITTSSLKLSTKDTMYRYELSKNVKDGHMATIFRACAVPVSRRNFFFIFIIQLLPSFPLLLPIPTFIFHSFRMSIQLIYLSLFTYLISVTVNTVQIVPTI